MPYTVGPLLQEVEVKIVDEKWKELPKGRKGIIMVKDLLVMKGYYKNKEATQKVLLPDGWLNTGDLGRLTLAGELQITGRAKDTIVLSGGENIEPMPIEQKLSESIYVHQVMIIGQDKKNLGALIVPDFEQLKAFAEEEKIKYQSTQELLDRQEIKNLYKSEIKKYINVKHGFRPIESISALRLLAKEFEVGDELTQTLKMKRNIIADCYKNEINSLYR